MCAIISTDKCGLSVVSIRALDNYFFQLDIFIPLLSKTTIYSIMDEDVDMVDFEGDFTYSSK
jgi:hypothetical protein